MGSTVDVLENLTDEETVSFGAMVVSTKINHFKAFKQWSYDETRKILPLSPLNIPTCALGDLDKLPAEVLTLIVETMDLNALFNLYHVNRMGRDLIGRSPMVRSVFNAAPACVRAILARGLGHQYTIGDLHRLLTATKFCEGLPEEGRTHCPGGHIGKALHLILKRRVCQRCLRPWGHQRDTVWRKQAVEEVLTTHFPGKLEAYKNNLQSIPSTTMSGPRWGKKAMKKTKGIYLYLPAVEEFVDERLGVLLRSYEIMRNIPRARAEVSTITMPLPYLRKGKPLELSLKCLGCPLWNSWWTDDIISPDIMDQDAFLEHFKTCRKGRMIARLRLESPGLWKKALRDMLGYSPIVFVPVAESRDPVLYDMDALDRRPRTTKRYNFRKRKYGSYRDRDEWEDEETEEE